MPYMNKSSAAALFALALLSAPSIAAANPSFVADGDLSVCNDPTFPPMEFKQNAGDANPVGVDVEVATALAELWGAKASFVTMDFNGLLPSLSAERCDVIISGITLTAERQKTFDAVGYLNTFVVIIGKAGAPALAGPEDLADKTVAVQSGTTYLTRMEKLNEALAAKGLAPMVIQQYPKQTDAIQQLEVGRVIGVVTQDTEVAFREFEKPGQFATIWTVPQDAVEPYSVYLRKNEADKAEVAKGVATLLSSGKLREIADKWKLSPKQLEGIQ
ncbi:MAG: transporter substrate-binding domain-containing protein [Rhizobiales bacterium]|nr:transporter substrate-binding domain-containing protein [Hyphomicrobiales bacterium]